MLKTVYRPSGVKGLPLDNVERLPNARTVNITLRRAPDGRLLLVNNESREAVRIRQCFPWSEPNRHISLRHDEEEEVALVDDPAELDAESRQALENALAEAGLVLEVTSVLAIEEEVEIRQWSVVTRQGRRRFQTHLDDWPRMLPGGGLLIRDVCGDLYRFGEPAALDKRSRELLWAFVD